jgi:predicted phage terminase large subunit-like protein
LAQELRKIGIPVQSYSPSRGQDKIARMNSVSPMFESGMIWATEDTFAEEVIEEMASFPYGENDDFADSANHGSYEDTTRWLDRARHRLSR